MENYEVNEDTAAVMGVNRMQLELLKQKMNILLMILLMK